MYNEHQGLINILIVETNNQNIYADKDKSIIAARSSDYIFKIVTVKKLVKISNKLYFNIEFLGKEIGFLKPEESIILIPKKNRQVKVREDAHFNNKINQYLSMSEDNFEKNKTNVAYSKYYAIQEGVIYESITHVDEILSFQKPKEINNLYKTAQNFQIKKDAVTFYDSAMTKKSKLIKSSDSNYVSKYIMPAENKIKFRYKGRDVWIKEEDVCIDYKVEEYPITDINEILLNSLLIQYSSKLENYHQYYLKVLNKELKR